MYKEKISFEKESDLKTARSKDNPNAYDQGILYKNKQDYEKAMKFFQEAAMSTNIKAQIMLADLYINHKGLAEKNSENKNYKTAFELFDDAADEKYWLAYYALSMCCQKGYGVNKDINKSTSYFNRAENNKNFVQK